MTTDRVASFELQQKSLLARSRVNDCINMMNAALAMGDMEEFNRCRQAIDDIASGMIDAINGESNA